MGTASFRVKNDLLHLGLASGMSTPILTRGFDNYLMEHVIKHPEEELKNVLRFDSQSNHTWTLAYPKHHIYCSTEIEILSKHIYKKLEPLTFSLST